VGWDGYIDVRGNRYSVPGELCGKTVTIRIGLDGELLVYCGDQTASSCFRGLGHGALSPSRTLGSDPLC